MIQKSKVIEGVYFVEIPEVNLYIQCGSPAESVKHLIKKGFIKKIFKNGIEFETGPNAILLSDNMIQNGDFSNISEFSVLQMLYKQGLIIPNHPNNTGLKPLLIGEESQVEAQMKYIYRGNYGLISKEEIIDCGIDEVQAQELYNMKLRFAFGKLHPPSNLLDSCFVSSSKRQIRDGVFIQRMAVNIFEITYKEYSVTIDLNLTDKQNYVSPYLLPQYKAQKEYFSIIQSGQGDGWDTLRPSMNSIICFQGKYYLVDAVPNISSILDSLSISINDIEGVFLTHCHDDHIGGITTLMRNDKKIKIFGAKIVTISLIKKLSSLLSLQESDFQNLLDIEELSLNSWNSIGDLEIRAIVSPHPVETTFFVFRTFFHDRYYTYGHFADIIDSDILKGMIVENGNQLGVTQEFYDKTIQEYRQTLDIKKIDIGEGMIHGHYKDFIGDKSGKIILGHNDKELSKEQLKVGTSSLFGLQDVLISTKQNYDQKTVMKYLKSNFPTLPLENLELFLNLEIRDFQPKELIYKNNQKIKNLYLIIAGLVEKSSHKFDNTAILEPGVIIGEKAALNGQVIDAIFMTKNYVKALEIPIEQFQYFAKKNNLVEYFSKKFEIGNNFLKNKLFSENISYPTLNKLITNMNIIECNETNYQFEDDLVYLIIEGSINILSNDTILDIIDENHYFGGFQTILNLFSSFKYTPLKKCTLFTIPASLIRDIPIAFWKMLEHYTLLQKKLISFSIYNDDHSTFLWNSSYHINIKDMDQQHRKQLEYLDRINNYTLSNDNDEKIYLALNELYNFSKKHFEDEERLMEKYHFDELENHRNIHKELLNKLLVFKEEMVKNSFDKSFIAVILKEWLLQHILEEDSKYSRYFNAKGIY